MLFSHRPTGVMLYVFCGRRKCALVDCCRDDMFLPIACGSLTGGAVGWRVRVLRGGLVCEFPALVECGCV